MNRLSAAEIGSLVTTNDTEWLISVHFCVLLVPVDEGQSLTVPVKFNGQIL